MSRIPTGAVHGWKSNIGILNMTPIKRSEMEEMADWNFSKENHLGFSLVTSYPRLP